MLRECKMKLGLFVIVFVLMATNVVCAKENEIVYDNTKEMQYVPEDTTDLDNDELFEGYVEKQFYGDKGISTFSVNLMGNRLQGNDKKAYDYLKTEIEKVANGERDNAVFSIPLSLFVDKMSFSAAELGVDSIVKNNAISSEAQEAMMAKISYDLSKVLDALLMDCPYELYWYEKTMGCSSSSGMGMSASHVSEEWVITYTTDNLTLKMYVDSQFSKSGSSGTYDVDMIKTSATKNAVSNAKAIVEDAKYRSDYEKLEFYANTICDMVSYNTEAAEKNPSGIGTISPWQLIYVFDGDSSTNVVCEGYSKAFQYLCEMTKFNHNDIYCMQVTGYMDGGGHMWNTVHMWDGKNYLVDVTNYENYYPYNDKSLFMDGADTTTSQNAVFVDSEGNEITKTLNGFKVNTPKIQISSNSYIPADTITYLYDLEMQDAYSEEELTLSVTAYTAPTKAEASGAPTEIKGCKGKKLNAQMLSDYPGWEWESAEYTIPSVAGSSITANVVYNGLDRGEYLTTKKEVTIIASEHDFGTGKTDTCRNCDVNNINGVALDNAITVYALTYNGAIQKPTVSISGVDASMYSVDVEGKTEAGTYSAQLNGIGSYSGSRTIEWKIEKAPLEASYFTMTPPSNKEYTGTAKGTTVKTKDKVTMNSQEVSISGIGAITVQYVEKGGSVEGLSTTAPVEVGNYDVYVQVAEGSNFVGGLLKIGSFSVEKASAEIAIDTEYRTYTKHYGDESFSLEGIRKTGDGKLSFSSGNEEVVKVSQTGEVEIVDVGETDITIHMEETAHYKAAVDQTVHISVLKKSVTNPDAIKITYYYGRNASDEIDVSGFVFADAGKVTYKLVSEKCSGIYADDPIVTDKGIVSYTVKAGAVDDTAKIVVCVTTDRYADMEITIDITLVEKRAVALKEGQSVSLVSNALVYGDKLSKLSFNSVEFVSGEDVVVGKLSFKNPNQVPVVADQMAEWIFEPADEAYASVTGMVEINVKKAIPSYTVPVDLVATCKDNISDVVLPDGFAWENPSQALAIGEENKSTVTFTPGDTDNYESVKGIAVVIAVAGHDFTDKDCEEKYLASEATCSSKARYYHNCSVCDVIGTTTFEVGEVDLTRHIWSSECDEVCDGCGEQRVGDKKHTLDGTACKECSAISLAAKKDILVKTDSVTYTGNEQNATVEVWDDTRKLVEGTDYEPVSVTRTVAGIYEIEVTGKGNYFGTAIGTWEIEKATPVLSSLEKVGDDIILDTAQQSTVGITGVAKANGIEIMGSFALENADDYFVEGTHTYSVIFTPKDITNYCVAKGSVELSVQRDSIVDVEITSNPTKMNYVYGDKFDTTGMVVTATYASGNQRNVTDEIVYEKNVFAGQTTLVLSYQYDEVTKELTLSGLTVEKADPSCKVPTNLFVYCGKKYSDIELPKGFAFEGDLDTVILGNQTDTIGSFVTFTPDDKDNYNVLPHLPVTITIRHDRNHTELKGVIAATNTNKGYTGDTCCKECGKVLVVGEEIPMLPPEEEKDKDTSGTGDNLAPELPKEEPVKVGEIVTAEGDSATYVVTDMEKKEVQYQVAGNNKTITVPDSIVVKGTNYSVTEIAPNAFRNNYSVTEVVIGKNVKMIGKNAFSGCKKLKSVTVGGNVKTVDSKAFYKCIALTKIVIPAKTNRIGKSAFEGCKKLKTVTIKSASLTSKNVESKAFKGIATNAKVKVPKSKYSAYKKWLKKRGVTGKKQKIIK